jgi:rhamnose transport system permease protein
MAEGGSIIRHELRAASVLRRWESLLVMILVVEVAVLSIHNPKIYTFNALLGNTQVFMDIGFQALGMMLILMIGDIDISVGSTAALSCTLMAMAYNKGDGVPFAAAVVLCLAVGALCGAINGFLVTRFKELFPMIITLSTMTVYRGIAYILLQDHSLGGFPRAFTGLGYNSLPGTNIPINFVCFLAVALVFGVWIHRTPSGRRIFAMGANLTASYYSGVRTDRTKFLLFTLNGLMAGVCGLFLAARTSSVRPNMALGYEMQAIAVVVLGGVSTAGGSGSVLGVVLSLFIIGFLKFGLKINNVDGQLEPMVIGVLLILIILLPNVIEDGRLRYFGAARRRAKHKAVPNREDSLNQ